MQLQHVDQYKTLLSFLSITLGPDYEINLYNYDADGFTLIALANGGMSGRNLGDSLGNMELNLLQQKAYQATSFQTNYTSIAPSGKALRSSSLLLQDEEGQPTGMICINFDSHRFEDFSKQVLELCHPDSYILKETTMRFDSLELKNETATTPTTDSLDALTSDIFSVALDNAIVPVEYLTQKERIEIVRMLQEKGVFLIKGAIPHVAEKLQCSTATIYRYLQQLD